MVKLSKGQGLIFFFFLMQANGVLHYNRNVRTMLKTKYWGAKIINNVIR